MPRRRPLPLAAALLAALACLAPHTRAQQGGRQAFQVPVATPEELREALTKEVAHIVITEHMDLTSAFANETFSAADGVNQYTSISSKLLRPGTKSIRGNCSAPLANPEGRFPPLLPQRRGQCLLTATVNLFEARHTLWIHNLYLRSNATALPTDAVVTQPFGLLAVAHAKLYVSSVTFQGEVTPQNATTVKNGLNLLALRTQAVSMGRGRAAGDGVEGPLATAPATLAVPAQVLLDDCVIQAFVSEQDVQFGSINFVRVAFSDMIMPAVRLEGPMAAANFFNVTFSRITANPVPEEADDSTLVADPLPTNQVFGDSQAAANISIPIKPSSTAAVGLFITDRDALFEQLQRAALSAPPATLAEHPDAPPGEPDRRVINYRKPDTAGAAARSAALTAAAVLAAAALVL